MTTSLEKLQQRNERLKLQAENLNLQMQIKARREAKRAYEAGIQSQYRGRKNVDKRSPDSAMGFAGHRIRDVARFLDENHDLAVGILDELVNNVVGKGISTLPMVQLKNGEPAEELNKEILRLQTDWEQFPEVTGEWPWGEAQRLTARTWFRDGEVFIQHIIGGQLDHLTEIPYSMELIEPDLCPFELPGKQRDNVVHGVEKDAWGRPRGYHFYLQHPGDALASMNMLSTNFETKRVPAEVITHLKFCRRIRQTRGISIFHAVITRLEDIKDAEESERIAARVAAAMCAAITKGDPSTYSSMNTNANGNRTMEFAPGMVFDNLLPGESIEVIGSGRPNPQMDLFRKSQLRAISAGTGTKYSSIGRDYNGTFSSQRQEMVEQVPAYGRLTELYVAKLIRRANRERINAAILSGRLRITRDVNMQTIYDADYLKPVMPWIDPAKEANATKTLLDAGLTSRENEIRKRGDDPRVIKAQRKKEREEEPQQQALPLPPANQSDDDEDTEEGKQQEAA